MDSTPSQKVGCAGTWPGGQGGRAQVVFVKGLVRLRRAPEFQECLRICSWDHGRDLGAWDSRFGCLLHGVEMNICENSIFS